MINLILLSPQKWGLKEIFELREGSKFSEEIFLRVATTSHSPLASEANKLQENGDKFCTVDFFDISANENEMLSALLSALAPCPFIIVRPNCNHLTAKNLDLIIEKLLSGADIAMFKPQKTSSKIKNFFARTYKKLCATFFGFTFFEGNISMVGFSSLTHKILIETSSATMTKLNRWTGVNIEYITLPSLPPATPHRTPTSIKLSLAISAFFTIAFLGGLIVLGVLGILNLTLFLLSVGGGVLSAIIALYYVLKLTLSRHIGTIKARKNISFGRKSL